MLVKSILSGVVEDGVSMAGCCGAAESPCLSPFMSALAAFTLLPLQQLVGRFAKSHDLFKLLNLRN